MAICCLYKSDLDGVQKIVRIVKKKQALIETLFQNID